MRRLVRRSPLKIVAIISLLPVLTNGLRFSFCTRLANETWAALVEAINDSYRLAVLCPFIISGEGCPREGEYPEGLVFGRGNDMIIECDPDLNDRFEDGTNTQCVINCPGRHFTVAPSTTGLILTNMVLSGATNTSVFVEAGGRLDVVNTVFTNNTAGTSNYGGAISAMDRSNVEIEFSTFKGNKALAGAGIYVQGGSIHVKQSEFRENEAMAAGGSIMLDAGSTASIRDSSFHGNEAADGGAMYVSDFASLELTTTDFQRNLSFRGGAIFNGGGSHIHESIFVENIGSESGGSIYVDAGSTTDITSNSFMNNGSGGSGPVVHNRFNSQIVAVENAACGNRVVRGGRTLRNRFMECNGIFEIVGRRRVRCQPFQEECNAPTSEPSSTPSLLPSVAPTSSPSDRPSMSTSPSRQPSSNPSWEPTLEPSQVPSRFPTEIPSQIPSDLPSLVPSLDANFADPSDISQVPSDFPSLIPSQRPSSEDEPQ